MKLINPVRLVRRAFEKGYAVPAFNTNGGNYDITRAAVEAAEEMGSPLIIQTYEPNLAYRGPVHAARIAEMIAETATIPVALTLDHGHSLESCKAVLEAGYTGVMIDGSHLPLAENIKITNEARDLADHYGASLEAEIGHIFTPSHGEKEVPPLTDPEEAVAFAKATEVDFLAVAAGTKHGIYDCQDTLDFDLLKKLGQLTGLPLVQHGTGGVSHAHLSKAVTCGIAKANFGEVFRGPYVDYFLEIEDEIDHQGHPWKIEQKIMERLKDDMKKLIVALGSEGKGR